MEQFSQVLLLQVSALDIHCNAFNPVEQGNTNADSPNSGQGG